LRAQNDSRQRLLTISEKPDATVTFRPLTTNQTLMTLSTVVSVRSGLFGSEVGPVGPTRSNVALGLDHVAPNTEEPLGNKHNVASEVISHCDDHLCILRNS